MAVLSATEKLKILATGKATLKEINELEKMAETEDAKNEPIVKVLEQPGANEPQPKEEPGANEPQPKEEPGANEPQPKEEPKEDEKDKRIKELEAQLKEAQADNVHGNNETPSVSFDEQLNEMFKDIRI